jgi:hypothetical protein
MPKHAVKKSFQEINARIKSGQVVVVTAEEMTAGLSRKKARRLRRVKSMSSPRAPLRPCVLPGRCSTSGTACPGSRPPACGSTTYRPTAGLAAVDCYLGATEPCLDDPLNKVYPGEFLYGGGHVIKELVAGKSVYLKADGLRDRLLPQPARSRKDHTERNAQRHLVQPAQRVPELQRGGQFDQENDPHLHGHPQAQNGQCQLLQRRRAQPAVQRPVLPNDRIWAPAFFWAAGWAT